MLSRAVSTLFRALVVLGFIGSSGAAFAQEFSRVDFFQGSLVNSGRVVGLGGAFVSVAEGGDGYLSNPAAFANRLHHHAHEWWDWDFALSSVRFLPEDETDLDRSGLPAEYSSSDRVYLGLNFYIERHGFGLFILNQTQSLNEMPNNPSTRANYHQNLAGLGYAYSFLDGDLVAGISLMGGSAELYGLDDQGKPKELADATIDEGSGFHYGILWAPCGHNYRVGASYRTAILVGEAKLDEASGRSAENDGVGTLIPNELYIPWEASFGASTTFGPRSYNPCPSFGTIEERKCKAPADRRYLLLSADLILTGATPKGIGMRSFLAGTTQRSGEHISLSPRFGAEAEILNNRLIVRSGSYYEPSRFSHSSGRMHLTGGVDMRLSLIWDWRIGFSVDTAKNYLNAGLGLGFWH